MSHALVARSLENPAQHDNRPPPANCDRRTERIRRLDFLETSARYLGRTLTTRELYLLAGFIDR